MINEMTGATRFDVAVRGAPWRRRGGGRSPTAVVAVLPLGLIPVPGLPPPAAIRGEFDPTPGVQNTERSSGLLLESLIQFPAPYSFQFVARPGPGDSQESLLDELRAVVER